MSEKIKNYAGYLSKKLQNRCLRNPAENMEALYYDQHTFGTEFKIMPKIDPIKQFQFLKHLKVR